MELLIGRGELLITQKYSLAAIIISLFEGLSTQAVNGPQKKTKCKL